MTERSGDGERDVDAHAPTEAASGDGTHTGPRSKRSPLSRPSVGRFRIDGPLGSGGMGDVYRAHDSVLDRAVALKVLRPDATNEDDAQRRRRVVREARAAAALTHPNTVTIFDVGEDGDEIFIAMELLEGEDLRAKLERNDASLNQKLRWLREAARALAAAHERGLVHRDVKPENMFVCKDGTLKLLDFGIAKRGEDEGAAHATHDHPVESLGPNSFKTAVGRRFGTPRYMAPEQHAGEPTDSRTDQYAWGLVAFELLTGSLAIDSLPTRTSDNDVQTGAADGAPARFAELRARVPELPEAIARIVQRALEPKKDERYPTMKEIVEALEGIELPDSRRTRDLEEGSPEPNAPARARTGASDVPARPRKSRARLLVGLAIGATVVACAVMGARAWRGRPALPLCKLQASRELALAPDDTAGFAHDGTLFFARRIEEKGIRLERESPMGTVVPFPLPKQLELLATLPHRSLTITGTHFDNAPSHAALIYQDGGNDAPVGALALVWNERASSTQRIFGPLSGAVFGEWRGSPIVVTTTFSNVPRLMKLPSAVELYPMKGGTSRSVIELAGGLFPTVATSDDRIVVAYVGDGGIRFAMLDSEMARVGDTLVVADIDAAPSVAFDGKRATVFWTEEKTGKNRLMSSTILLGQPKFSPPRVAIEEPIARGRPTVVPLAKERNALAWVTAVGGMSTLRMAPIAGDGSLIGPANLATAANVKDVFSATAHREPAVLAWSEKPGLVRAGEITCAAEPR